MNCCCPAAVGRLLHNSGGRRGHWLFHNRRGRHGHNNLHSRQQRSYHTPVYFHHTKAKEDSIYCGSRDGADQDAPLFLSARVFSDHDLVLVVVLLEL